MLFGDNNTLWIGSQSCATGEGVRLAGKPALQSNQTHLDRSANYNCLTCFDRSGLTATVVPAVTQVLLE